MELRLGKSAIRPWRKGDEASIVRHANNYKIWRNLRDRFPYPYTLKDAAYWIELTATETPRTSFAIEVDDHAVGGIGLILRDDIYRCSAEIGYWLGEEYWGRGIVSEAVGAVTAWAFAEFNLSRIYAGVLEWNGPSMRVLEKAGYRLEARLKNAIVKEGQVMDELVYSILRESISGPKEIR